MDKDILKLLPQRAFKLLSLKDSIKVGGVVTKSLMNHKEYQSLLEQRKKLWKWDDIQITNDLSIDQKLKYSAESGERILLIYFAQFFENDMAIHLDFRDSFSSSEHLMIWKPSKMHYKFSKTFTDGVRDLYSGFYLNDLVQFESGLMLIGIIQKHMSQQQKDQVIDLFTRYFGEGKNEAIHFSLPSLQQSFNEIFSFFIKQNIPLNPEFAVLGLALVTLYSELQKISQPLDVKSSFLKVHNAYTIST